VELKCFHTLALYYLGSRLPATRLLGRFCLLFSSWSRRTGFGRLDLQNYLYLVCDLRNSAREIVAVVNAEIAPVDLGFASDSDLRTGTFAPRDKTGHFERDRNGFRNTPHCQIAIDDPPFTLFRHARALKRQLGKLFHVKEISLAKMTIAARYSRIDAGGHRLELNRRLGRIGGIEIDRTGEIAEKPRNIDQAHMFDLKSDKAVCLVKIVCAGLGQFHRLRVGGDSGFDACVGVGRELNCDQRGHGDKSESKKELLHTMDS
jgi:hypothetical protein